MSLGRGLVGSLCAVLALLAARHWLDVVEVRGRSMSPALLPGDRLLVARLAPRVADVVVASDPRDPRRELIKRVVRAGGSWVDLRGDSPIASTDSRAFGPVPARAVRWRAVLRYWPLDRVGRVAAAGNASDGGELRDASRPMAN